MRLTPEAAEVLKKIKEANDNNTMTAQECWNHCSEAIRLWRYRNHTIYEHSTFSIDEKTAFYAEHMMKALERLAHWYDSDRPDDKHGYDSAHYLGGIIGSARTWTQLYKKNKTKQ